MTQQTLLVSSLDFAESESWVVVVVWCVGWWGGRQASDVNRTLVGIDLFCCGQASSRSFLLTHLSPALPTTPRPNHVCAAPSLADAFAQQHF